MHGGQTYPGALGTVRAVLGMFTGPDAELAPTVVFVRRPLLAQRQDSAEQSAET